MISRSVLKKRVFFLPEVETAVYLGGEVEEGEGGQRLVQERLAEGFQTRPDV